MPLVQTSISWSLLSLLLCNFCQTVFVAFSIANPLKNPVLSNSDFIQVSLISDTINLQDLLANQAEHLYL